MAMFTEREAQQVEQANSSGRTPVAFIHGLWPLPSSWDRWAQLFEHAARFHARQRSIKSTTGDRTAMLKMATRINSRTEPDRCHRPAQRYRHPDEQDRPNGDEDGELALSGVLSARIRVSRCHRHPPCDR